MTITPDRLDVLDTISLDKGSHRSFDDGHCAMEVVAWLAGEGITDAPTCASQVHLLDRMIDPAAVKA